jgi:biopolymer transport protein ExbD
MIDVLMQLLIFFMCGTHFRSLEGKLTSHLPKDKGIVAGGAVLNPNMDEYRIRLVFDVTKTKPHVMTRVMVGPQELQGWDELYQVISKYYQEDRAKGKDTPFKIDADAKVPFQSVVSTLNACQQAGVTNVEFTAATPVDQPIH